MAITEWCFDCGFAHMNDEHEREERERLRRASQPVPAKEPEQTFTLIRDAIVEYDEQTLNPDSSERDILEASAACIEEIRELVAVGEARVSYPSTPQSEPRQKNEAPYFARATMARPRFPETVDKSSAREVLEFITRSSYPTAADPLLAVAHVAAAIIQSMHDELHRVADDMRRSAPSAEPSTKTPDESDLREVAKELLRRWDEGEFIDDDIERLREILNREPSTHKEQK